MKLRRDSEAPKCRKSKIDIEEPTRQIPYTDIAEPKRRKLRRDRDEPRFTKSSTDIDAPSRAIPKTDTDEPKRK